MVDVVRRARAVARDASAVIGTRPRASTEAISRFLRSLNIWFWAIVGLPTLIAGVYYFGIASDLYSSEVKFMVRGPSRAPANTITAMLSIVWITLPTTCPVSTDTRAMAMVRKRAMMPSVISIATEIAVPVTWVEMAIRMIAGVT